MANLSREDLYDTLAHPRSAPAAYFTAKTLPAAGAATDPSAGTIGDGLAIPVPSWARNATIFITYALGAGAGAGTADAAAWAGPAVGSSLAALSPTVGSGNIGTDGAALLAAGIGGMGTIGVRIQETGDTAHPGIVGINVVFSV